MTLQEFSRDIIPIMATVISLVSLVFLGVGLISLKLLKEQIQLAAKSSQEGMIWNRNNAHHTFFANVPNPEKERALVNEMVRLNLDPDGPIPKSEIERIRNDVEFRLAIRHYLNELEELCAAVHAGTVDEDLAYGLDASVVIRRYNLYKEFIVFLRGIRNDETLYLELQTIAVRWEERAKNERSDVAKKIAELDAQAAHAKHEIASTRTIKPKISGHRDSNSPHNMKGRD